MHDSKRPYVGILSLFADFANLISELWGMQSPVYEEASSYSVLLTPYLSLYSNCSRSTRLTASAGSRCYNWIG
jgi:hypothetical protein